MSEGLFSHFLAALFKGIKSNANEEFSVDNMIFIYLFYFPLNPLLFCLLKAKGQFQLMCNVPNADIMGQQS